LLDQKVIPPYSGTGAKSRQNDTSPLSVKLLEFQPKRVNFFGGILRNITFTPTPGPPFCHARALLLLCSNSNRTYQHSLFNKDVIILLITLSLPKNQKKYWYAKFELFI
jgi:hypothetical protein